MVKLSTWIYLNFLNQNELAIIIKGWALIETIIGTLVILFVDFGLIIYSIYHVYYKHLEKEIIKSRFIRYFI
ncbi:hypothetical protein [Spiroplasma sp. SV19]|uniref:hypothetical protein n=1 Tax=Spiroplasma sp. SV19 TaxID=2570468 RepID=UPI0024B6730B|nr:hypothetical protein [Spiroplasma sp. SV19]